MPVMNFDLQDGEPQVSFVLKPADAERFMAFMAECETGRADAARYRWLRDFAPTEVEFDHNNNECGLNIHVPCDWNEDPQLNDAVDALMAVTPVSEQPSNG
jgi:hypothetical protein